MITERREPSIIKSLEKNPVEKGKPHKQSKQIIILTLTKGVI